MGLTKRGKGKKGHKTSYPVGQKAIQFVRKPIVPVTPNFDLDLTKNHEDLAFIDEGHHDEEELHKGPMQVGKIK